MKYLFWNTHKQDVDEYLYEMVSYYKPTILTLAEYEKSVEDLVSNIARETDREYIALEKLACKICILVSKNIGNKITHCADHTNYTIKILPYNSFHDSHIVAFVHLPSKMYENKERNRHLLEQITAEINRLDSSGNRKALIFGDFNLNPYEDAMTYLTGCNAVSSRKVAMKISREDRSEKDKHYFYYYNPMWNFLGDNVEPHGTFYYGSTPDHSRYWNTFDQFVVSPQLINDIGDIKIVNKIGKIDFGNRNGKPKVSDHYPLYFKLGGK